MTDDAEWLGIQQKGFVKYIDMKQNFLADSLSRLQIAQFKKLAPLGTNSFPDKISSQVWPIDKVWMG